VLDTVDEPPEASAERVMVLLRERGLLPAG
jgi:hypothetical protein